MKAGVYKRPRVIVCAAAALYAVALAVAWRQGTAKAKEREREILESAERSYGEVINGEVDAVLKYLSGAVLNLLGGRCEAYPSVRLQAIADELNIDEINIVDRDGMTVSSNLPDLIGIDFRGHSLTAAFMALTNGTVSIVSQPFRKGVTNPGMYCKYFGVAFPGNAGVLQLGLTVDRLKRNMYNTTKEESARALREWRFSVVGWYQDESDNPDFVHGRMFRRWDDAEGTMTACRFFNYRGYLYSAVIPEYFCLQQRNAMFATTALVLLVLVGFFTFILVRLARASTRLEALHAAADARTAADLALARKIQMSALPATGGAFLDWMEFSIATLSRPAREVGGDFYDFYPLPGGRVAFVIADASGKGIPAAMFMMEAKNVLKECLLACSSLSDAVTAANARLCGANEAEMFVTAWVGALDPRTGRVEYVNAGHNRPYVRRSDGSVEKVAGKGGLFLGMFPDAEYRTHAVNLAAGDRLFLFTDGIPEAMDAGRRLFGEGRMAAALEEDRVMERLSEFVGTAEQSDDITVLSVGWNGVPGATERSFPCREETFGEVIAFVRQALAGCEAKAVARMLNAADEVMTNIVNYSGASDFSVAVERTADRMRVTFADAGMEYNPLSHVDPDVSAPIEERGVGGLGLVMVKKLANRVVYSREGGRNILKITLLAKG